MADKPEIDEDTIKKADRAAEVFSLISAILKDEDEHVAGAALGSLVAGYIAAHDFDEQRDAMERLMLLASAILRDVNKANGIPAAGDVQFQLVYEDGVREEMEKDPKVAEFVREQTSRVHQAFSDLEAGKYDTIGEAMTAIGLKHVDPDELEEIKSKFSTSRKLS